MEVFQSSMARLVTCLCAFRCVLKLFSFLIHFHFTMILSAFGSHWKNNQNIDLCLMTKRMRLCLQGAEGCCVSVVCLSNRFQSSGPSKQVMWSGHLIGMLCGSLKTKVFWKRATEMILHAIPKIASATFIRICFEFFLDFSSYFGCLTSFGNILPVLLDVVQLEGLLLLILFKLSDNCYDA